MEQGLLQAWRSQFRSPPFEVGGFACVFFVGGFPQGLWIFGAVNLSWDSRWAASFFLFPPVVRVSSLSVHDSYLRLHEQLSLLCAQHGPRQGLQYGGQNIYIYIYIYISSRPGKLNHVEQWIFDTFKRGLWLEYQYLGHPLHAKLAAPPSKRIYRVITCRSAGEYGLVLSGFPWVANHPINRQPLKSPLKEQMKNQPRFLEGVSARWKPMAKPNSGFPKPRTPPPQICSLQSPPQVLDVCQFNSSKQTNSDVSANPLGK